MGAQIDTGGGSGKNLNVELNVVPFIDLLSCLTAFLMVTAVWSNLAQINIKPKGIGRDTEKVIEEEPPPKASVLVTQNAIWVGLTIGDRRQIANTGEGQYDFAGLEEVLREYKEMAIFTDREEIELAAEDAVVYDDIIGAMDTSIASGFKDVGFVDPNSLSVRFTQ